MWRGDKFFKKNKRGSTFIREERVLVLLKVKKWLERSKYYQNKDYAFGLLLNLSSVWYLDSPEFLGIWSEDRSMTLHFTRKLLPTSPMLMIWHNVNLMYYEGITDTPFLFQWLFPDSEQAKNFVSN